MQKYKLKIAKQKYKLIYFTKILKRYNIIASIILAGYNIEVKQDIKI